MIELKIEHDIDELRARLNRIEPKKWGKAIKYASKETAFYVRNKVRKEMPNYIDRPTRYTLNSIYVNMGSEKNEAIVQWRQSASSNSGGRYLRPIAHGENRHQKGFEKFLQFQGFMPRGYVAIPTKDAPVDAYGNIPSVYIRRLMRTLYRNPDGLKGKGRTTLFVVPSWSKGKGLMPGIYERTQTAFKGNGFNGTAVRRLFTFLPQAKYRKSFPFYMIAQQAAKDKFPSKLEEAIKKTLDGEKGW